MPNQIDLYEPRKLMRVVRSNPPVRTFLRDTFFRDRKTFTTKTFDVDFVKGAREIAPFCSESIEGTVVKNTGYSTKNYEGAYIAPYTITIAHDLISRSPGEQLYSDRKPAERAVEKLAGDFARLEDMATRREEWMCAKALFTGKIPIKGKGVDRIIDFGFTNNETITDAAKKWTSPTALPLGDLGRWRGTVQEKGFVNCNVCLMAGDAAKSFINNPSVKEMLDIRDYHLAVIAPRELPNGVKYIGTIQSEGMDIYTYNEKFLDDTQPDANDNPTLQPLVPPGTVALLSTNADYSMYYGAITYIPEGEQNFITVDGIRVPHSWIEHRPDRRFLQLQSRPLPVPHEVDSWFVAKVQ